MVIDALGEGVDVGNWGIGASEGQYVKRIRLIQ